MITQFAILLSQGMSLIWCLMPRRQVTSGFFRIQCLVVLGLSVLAALAAGRLSPAAAGSMPTGNITGLRAAAIAAAVMAYLGSAFWRLDLRTPGTACLFGVFLSTFAGMLALTPGLTTSHWQLTALRILSSWTSAAVLGGVTSGMLLGHWYLTAPSMSIDPLKRVTHLFFLALVARLIVSAWGWSQSRELLAGSLVLTWWALRWIAGILCPLILAVMTDRILRYRNTQAATGVLFAGVILVFLGEMSAALLQAELAAPL